MTRTCQNVHTEEKCPHYDGLKLKLGLTKTVIEAYMLHAHTKSPTAHLLNSGEWFDFRFSSSPPSLPPAWPFPCAFQSASSSSPPLVLCSNNFLYWFCFSSPGIVGGIEAKYAGCMSFSFKSREEIAFGLLPLSRSNLWPGSSTVTNPRAAGSWLGLWDGGRWGNFNLHFIQFPIQSD